MRHASPLGDVAARTPGAALEGPHLLRLPLVTPTLPPATMTNHYVIGTARAVIVDPATPERRGQARLCSLARDLASAGCRVEALVLTHHHRDHVGAAVALRDRLGVPILAHATTAAILESEVPVDRHIGSGDVIAADADGGAWQVLHTPGHAPGHVVLVHQPSRWIVAGDMVAGQGTILVDPRRGSMADYLASLERMAQTRPTFLAPAHGPVLPDAPAVLSRYRAHRLEREARISAALPSVWTDPADLLPAAYGDVSRLAWPFALRAMLAHLVHLAEQGRAEQRDGRWRRVGVAG